jgi:CBS domain-containing protein
MKVESLMMQGVASCRAEDAANQAALMMWERDCGAIPVVDEDSHVVAMVTDRDLCMASSLEGKALREIPVRSAMSQHLWSCSREDELSDAEQIMREHRVRRLPVVDREGRLEGILSLSDLVREASKPSPSKSKKVGVSYEDVAATLSDISVPHDAIRAVVKAS